MREANEQFIERQIYEAIEAIPAELGKNSHFRKFLAPMVFTSLNDSTSSEKPKE